MDRRQQKTRTAIFSAFEQLLSQQSYNKITVQDIIDAANVGRTTFYAHFETKDALLKQLCDNLFSHVFAEHSDMESSHDFSLSEGDSRTIVTHILYHLKDNGQTIARLLTGESSDVFLFYFRQYLDSAVYTYLANDLVHGNTRVPESFLKNQISGSFVNMVQWWIRGGMQESPENLADDFLAVIEPIL